MNHAAWISALGTAVLASSGCSLALDLEAAQCEVTADCLARGEAFAHTECFEGTCRELDTSLLTNQSGGNSGGSAGAPRDDSGGTPNTGGAGANGGEGGGAGAPSGCQSTAQCIDEHRGEPWICPAPGGDCISLKTDSCPQVFGNFADPEALYVGALLNMPESAPLSQMSVLNVELAVREIEGSVGGLPGGPMGSLRPVAVIACRNSADAIESGAEHLIEEIGVPAVIAHLPSADLKHLFVDYALPNEVFVLNPGFADNTLTTLSTQGLFWHVIGDVSDVAPAYAPLLTRVEKFVDEDGSEGKRLRVAMIVASRYAEQSVADTMIPLLTFNGESVIDNGDDFFTMTIPALLDEPEADYSAVNAELLDFKPHVIIAVAREEFVYKMYPVIEGEWDNFAPGQDRPFYVLPTSLLGNLDLLNYVGDETDGSDSEDKRQRIVGVAPAAPEDMTLYEQFLVRFRSTYPEFDNPGGFENFYDAVYLLVDAMYAAGSSLPEISGPDIARGMQRVVSGSLPVNVGPTHIADAFAALATGGSIQLVGTMGPSDFDPGVGARRGSGSIYCIQRTEEGLSFAYDVLRYDRETKALYPEDEFPCIPGF